ncbi:DUF3182 family protein [Pseudomonas sp. R5(2019)]|uniref:DUF3182 family protein n=1 Tax=Pseudomonas sp. R5(2019) TaxID=2697566 RepID=UPI001411D772|nr:DUF3182 family protein [Pseudomonas sp. R5(2019)]NBA95989.1 DUF3182 family protein [Pseudomonas sp. R5(2019)]
MPMTAPIEAKTGVVLLTAEDAKPAHEHEVHIKLAERLANILGTEFFPAALSAAAGERRYYLPTDTLIDPERYRQLGIETDRDFFGGMVSQPFMATKAISHPLPGGAMSPLGWTDDFALRASDALLRGYSVFSLADAQMAADLLFIDGPLRLKPVRATAGRGQCVIHNRNELDAILSQLDEEEISTWGLVLEENLTDVETFSVGQVMVAGIIASYYGTQNLTQDHAGETVYGGSELVLVRGDYDQLLQLDMDKPTRLAVNQARLYEQAAIAALPGFVASRRNYDVARGTNAQGKLRSGVLEQSWRIGGASSAEVLALEAFADDLTLQRLRASTHEIYGETELPADATLFYQGDDSDVGFITKYARVRPYDHP